MIILYFGTFNGLSIYDGIRIKNYNYENGLPNDPITDIFEDVKVTYGLGYNKNGLVEWKNGEILKHFTKKMVCQLILLIVYLKIKKWDILIGTNGGFSI